MVGLNKKQGFRWAEPLRIVQADPIIINRETAYYFINPNNQSYGFKGSLCPDLTKVLYQNAVDYEIELTARSHCTNSKKNCVSDEPNSYHPAHRLPYSQRIRF